MKLKLDGLLIASEKMRLIIADLSNVHRLFMLMFGNFLYIQLNSAAQKFYIYIYFFVYNYVKPNVVMSVLLVY